jgi:hypothetical protein
MLPDPKEQPTMTVEEARQLLGLSRASAYTAVKTGALPTRRFGKRIVVLTGPLVEMLNTPVRDHPMAVVVDAIQDFGAGD